MHKIDFSWKQINKYIIMRIQYNKMANVMLEGNFVILISSIIIQNKKLVIRKLSCKRM